MAEMAISMTTLRNDALTGSSAAIRETETKAIASVADIDRHLMIRANVGGPVRRNRQADDAARDVRGRRGGAALELLREPREVDLIGSVRALRKQSVGAPVHGHGSRWSGEREEIRIAGGVSP